MIALRALYTDCRLPRIVALVCGSLACASCNHAAAPSTADLLQSGPHAIYAASSVEQNPTAALGATTMADAITHVIVIAYPIAIQDDLNAADCIVPADERDGQAPGRVAEGGAFRVARGKHVRVPGGTDLAKSPTVRIETDDGHVGVTCSDELTR